MKNFKVAYYIAALFVAGVAVLYYTTEGTSEQTTPKIKLSYFKSNTEVAESINDILKQEQKAQNHFWFGVEPSAPRELEIYQELKAIIEKENGPFDLIYVDRELKLNDADKSLFGTPTIREIKEDWGGVAKDIQANNGKKILVVTASIYSTNLIPQNPISKMKTVAGFTPTTLSMGYFAVKPQDERKNVFPCMTDDKEGIAAWGCLVVNKARSQRRKLDIKQADSSIVGVMDQTGDKDYMIVIR